ncbi:hypothetical protein LTS18_004806 [Coniosporium uncinatum]|uniref:Uncharacterized protein n=1 Tax=Coniosporium uncinatum TaxID=93489 RepID=A0ACC3DRX0_9PEZI|nr:hypothetical protein LTS18_004806 [Coniosporium uncinatum]
MSFSLNEKELASTFDKLVEAGDLLYGPSTVVHLEDNHFPFEFRICPALQSKPLKPTDDTPDDTPSASDDELSYDPDATFGPGSDIKRGPAAFLIETLSSTHHLIFNKFCVFRPQYMLITADSYRRQEEALDLEDLTASWKALNALPSPHFLFYNCTPQAGNSREHKHMQLAPFALPDSGAFELFPDMAEQPEAPFVFFLQRFQGLFEFVSGKKLLNVYRTMLYKAREALEMSAEAETVPHNVILTKQWFMVIPRRKADVGVKPAVNAAGMLGMVWCEEDEQLEQWKTHGPAKVLMEAGVPAS